MDFLLDDNIPPIFACRLRAAGHGVKEVRSVAPIGNRIMRTVAVAVRDRRLFVTTGLEFRFFRKTDHAGILILRLRRPNRERLQDALWRALRAFPESDWPGLNVEANETTFKSLRRTEPVDLGS